MFGFGSPPMGGFHHPGFGPPSPYRSAPAMSPQHTSPHQALSEVSTNVPSPFGGVHTAPSGGPSARGNGFFSPMGPFSTAPASATINSTTGAAASKEVAASSVSSPTPAPSPKAASPKIRTVSQAPLPSQQVQQRYRAGSAPSFAGVVGPRFGGSGAMLRSSRSDELLDGPSGGNFWDDAAGPTASAAGTGGASSMGGAAPFSPPAATSTASPDRPAAAASPSPPSDGAETTAAADIEAATALFESLAIAGGNNDGDGVTGRLASGDVKAADQAECSCTSGSSKNMCRSCTAKRDQLLSFANGCPTLTRLYALGEVLYAHETNVVFRAHRKSLPGATGECVVKIFSSSSTRAGEAPHEARMLSGLRSHDNVVDLLTWHALGDGKFAVVIPWVDAESFSVRSSTPAERRDYMAQLLAGLAHLHAARVMHLDIKPGNVLRERKSGRVVIIDFDSAERVDPYDPVYELLGTDGYIAPEVLNPNVAATAKADVWSAGAMMYELVYETYIEDDDAPADLYARARGDAHRSAAHDLLARLLEPSPDRRLSAADALSHPYFA